MLHADASRAEEGARRALERHADYIQTETLCVDMGYVEELQAEVQLLNGLEVAMVLECVVAGGQYGGD